jgi:D-amino-acid oxidase
MTSHSRGSMRGRQARRADILVIGAGVMGLTSGICLSEAGFDVTILARELPSETTSATAGAIWGPYEVEPFNQVDRWGRTTLAELQGLATVANSGVKLTAGRQMARQVTAAPLWSRHLSSFRSIPPESLTAQYRSGWRFVAPVLDMPRYLDYLADRLRAAGGTVRRGTLDRIPADTAGAIVVNCSGVGARSLVPDPTVRPIRGQSVVVTNPGVTEFFVEMRGTDAKQLYIFPHSDNVVLGGTFEDGESDCTADPNEARRIIDECTEIEPTLRGAEIVEHRVGLRPSRPQVRFEMIRRHGATVFHNYGQGGAGVSISWGCARELTDTIMNATLHGHAADQQADLPGPRL